MAITFLRRKKKPVGENPRKRWLSKRRKGRGFSKSGGKDIKKNCHPHVHVFARKKLKKCFSLQKMTKPHIQPFKAPKKHLKTKHRNLNLWCSSLKKHSKPRPFIPLFAEAPTSPERSNAPQSPDRHPKRSPCHWDCCGDSHTSAAFSVSLSGGFGVFAAPR